MPRINWLRVALLVVASFVSVFLVFVFLVMPNRPPKEANLIEGFYAHRLEYDQIRDMLLADSEVVQVANWGIQTADERLIRPPLKGPFASRYSDYLELLKKTGAKTAFRGRGPVPEFVGVTVWVSGYGGDTRHVWIGWYTHEPANLVASLDAFYQTPKPRAPSFRHIDANWYLGADW